jgi:hypothetical protein
VNFHGGRLTRLDEVEVRTGARRSVEGWMVRLGLGTSLAWPIVG